MEENKGCRGNLHEKYFQINFYFLKETLKFYPYTYRRVAKAVQIKCKNEIKKINSYGTIL